MLQRRKEARGQLGKRLWTPNLDLHRNGSPVGEFSVSGTGGGEAEPKVLGGACVCVRVRAFLSGDL